MISREDVEPGAVLSNRFGQIREIVSLAGKHVTFRVLKLGSKPGPRDPMEGRPGDCTMGDIAEWADRVIA